jgi:hypothetical protein
MPLHQPITIHFKRGAPSSTLTVKRADGSSTWTKLYPGTEMHDLAHHAVEETLALDHAFYGILAQGYDIDEFEAPKDERHPDLQPKNLKPEAIQTEHLVNLLLTELQYGVPIDDFLVQFNSILQQSSLPPMDRLTTESLAIIRSRLSKLCTCWRATKTGEILELRLE